MRKLLLAVACSALLAIFLAAPVAAQSAEQYGSGEAAIRATWPAHEADTAIAVASCESGLDPYAYNESSGASGLFQFIPSTAYAMGLYDPFDPYANSAAAYELYLTSGWSPWVCGGW